MTDAGGAELLDESQLNAPILPSLKPTWNPPPLHEPLVKRARTAKYAFRIEEMRVPSTFEIPVVTNTKRVDPVFVGVDDANVRL